MTRGLNPRQMKRLMKQMGISTKEVEGAKEVIIKFEGKEWVIKNPQISIIIQAGQEIYQIIGKKSERISTTSSVNEAKIEISPEDISLVVAQTGATPEAAKKALEETEGDLARAIMMLKA